MRETEELEIQSSEIDRGAREKAERERQKSKGDRGASETED